MAAQVLQQVRQAEGRAPGAEAGGNTFPALLKKSRHALAMALPKHMDPDRIMRTALTAYRMAPKLAKCDPMSVLAQVVQAAQIGVEIGVMGEAFLVPFKAECQLIVGYAGLIKLARQAGTVDVYAHEVYENDEFHMELGLERKLLHRPLTAPGGFPASAMQRGELTGFYAVAVEQSGYRRFYPMGVERVLEIRNASKSYKAAKQFGFSSPWDTDFVEMGKKTAVRALMKYAVKSPQLTMAFAVNDTADAGKSVSLEQAADGVWTPVIDPETGEIAGGSKPDAN